MAFHKNLVEKDLHAPSRFKVKNENLLVAIPAFTAVAIEEFDGGLLTVIPIQRDDHTGLYGITETIIPASGEGFITTFGILRNVPRIPNTISQFEAIDINPDGGTDAGALIERTFDTMVTPQVQTSVQVAIALTRVTGVDPDILVNPDMLGTATIFVTGGIPGGSGGGAISGGSSPSSVEEFKGFFDPNNTTDDLPTDILANTDNVRAGDYFIVNVEANGTNPNSIFQTVIETDLIFVLRDDDPNNAYTAVDFVINRTITEEEREILQDLKPADDGVSGDILLVRDPDPTDPLGVEKDYELRKPYTTDIDEPIDYPVSSPPATYPVNSVVRLPDGNIYRAIFDPTLINPITTRPSANLTDFLVTTDWAVVSSDSATKNLYVSHDERIQKLDPIPDSIIPNSGNEGAILISDGVSPDLEFRIPTTIDVPDNGADTIPALNRRYVSQEERDNKINPLPDDIRPVAGTTDGFVVISDPSNSTDLQFRMADAAEVTVSDSVHFPSDNTVEEALVDLTARIRSISPNDFQGDWDATGEPAASEYRAGYFWRIEVNNPTMITVGSPGVAVTVNTNDLIYYDGADAPSVANLEDFFVLDASSVPTDVIDNINFVSTTPGTQTQVGISFDTVRGVTTPLPLIQEDAIGTISIAVPPSDPNIVEISTSGDQIPVGTQITSPGVGGNPDIIIEATQEIDIGFTNINNKIDALTTDNIPVGTVEDDRKYVTLDERTQIIEQIPPLNVTGDQGKILIQDSSTGGDLSFRLPLTTDIGTGLDVTDDALLYVGDGLRTDNLSRLLSKAVDGKMAYQGIFDANAGDLWPTNPGYAVDGWVWYVSPAGAFGSPSKTVALGQLIVFTAPTEIRVDEANFTSDNFLVAGGSGTGGMTTGRNNFAGEYNSINAAPIGSDAAFEGDYWVVTDVSGGGIVGSSYQFIADKYGDTLRTGDLVIKTGADGAAITSTDHLSIVRAVLDSTEIPYEIDPSATNVDSVHDVIENLQNAVHNINTTTFQTTAWNPNFNVFPVLNTGLTNYVAGDFWEVSPALTGTVTVGGVSYDGDPDNDDPDNQDPSQRFLPIPEGSLIYYDGDTRIESQLSIDDFFIVAAGSTSNISDLVHTLSPNVFAGGGGSGTNIQRIRYTTVAGRDKFTQVIKEDPISSPSVQIHADSDGVGRLTTDATRINLQDDLDADGLINSTIDGDSSVHAAINALNNLDADDVLLGDALDANGVIAADEFQSVRDTINLLNTTVETNIGNLSESFIGLTDVNSTAYPGAGNSFDQVNTDAATILDLVVPVVESDGADLSLSSLLTFESSTTQESGLGYSSGTTSTIFTNSGGNFDSANIPYADTVSMLRTSFSSTSRLTIFGRVTAISDINGFEVVGGITLSVPAPSNVSDAASLSIVSFNLTTTHDAVILDGTVVDPIDPSNDVFNRQKSYDTSNQSNDLSTLAQGQWFSQETGGNNRILTITLNEPVIRAALIAEPTSNNTTIGLTSVVIDVTITGTAGSPGTSDATDQITRTSNIVTMENPSFNSISTGLLDANDDSPVSINSFFKEFTQVRLSFNNYSEPVDFGPLIATDLPGTIFPTDTTNPLDRTNSSTTLRSQAITVDLDSADYIHTGTVTLPTFTATPTFTHINTLFNLTNDDISGANAVIGTITRPTFGFNVWLGTIPPGVDPLTIVQDNLPVDNSTAPAADLGPSYIFSNRNVIDSIFQIDDNGGDNGSGGELDYPAAFQGVASDRILIVSRTLINQLGPSGLTRTEFGATIPILDGNGDAGNITISGLDSVPRDFAVIRITEGVASAFSTENFTANT